MAASDDDAFLYELLKGNYDNQTERRRDLDGKASSLMGYVSIITGITIALGTKSFHDALTMPQFYITYFGGIASLLISVITALIASRIMVWSMVPNIANLYGESLNGLSKLAMTNRRISELWKAVIINHKNNEDKGQWIMVSWIFLVAGLILLATFLSIYAITPIPQTQSCNC